MVGRQGAVSAVNDAVEITQEIVCLYKQYSVPLFHFCVKIQTDGQTDTASPSIRRIKGTESFGSEKLTFIFKLKYGIKSLVFNKRS